MYESQFLALGRNPFLSTLHYRECMNVWRPSSSFFDKESQQIVGISAMHESSHEIVFAWYPQSFCSILMRNMLVEIFLVALE